MSGPQNQSIQPLLVKSMPMTAGYVDGGVHRNGREIDGTRVYERA
jgi:hypothetical protein